MTTCPGVKFVRPMRKLCNPASNEGHSTWSVLRFGEGFLQKRNQKTQQPQAQHGAEHSNDCERKSEGNRFTHSITARMSSASTVCPAATLISLIVPEAGATTGISIFMASITMTVSSSRTF